MTPEPPEPQHIAQLLFNLVFCLPCDRHYVTYPAHDFGGALNFWSTPTNISESWGFLLADPNKPAPIPPTSSPQYTSVDILPILTEAFEDCFSRLPLEVNHLIAILMKSSDLCSLRLSSRTIAWITKLNHLPQSFWASRFSVDKEMNFVPLNHDSFPSLESGADWRGLYFEVKHALRDRTVAGYTRNRRRVWQCIHHLTKCLIPLIYQKPRLQDEYEIESDIALQGYEAGQLCRGLARHDDMECTGMGTRLFGSQCLIFRPAASEVRPTQIAVSFITFNCTEYVCGMRVLERDEIDHPIDHSRAGLIMPRSELRILVMPRDRMVAIRVASSICGIVGISFRFENEAGGTSWRTAGIFDNPPVGVGISTLEPRVGYRASGLIAGLDACKFVSIQLLECQLDPPPLENTPTLTTNAMPRLWHPSEPDPCDDELVSISTLEQPQTALEPTFLLNMDFGGPGGTLLSRLNRVVALHDDCYGSFRGFAFHYTDGTKKTFGTTEIVRTASQRWACIELSLGLDGPGGERIVDLSFVQKQWVWGIRLQVIKMITNYGRLLEFRQHESPSCDSKHENEQELPLPAGKLVTGIVATVHLSTWSLQSLGARCWGGVSGKSTISPPNPPAIRRLGAKDSHRFPIDQVHLKKAPRELRKSACCFSSVELSNVRRIGLSTGIPGRTREADHVCGLCFEFWDLEVPVFVGQWFREIGNLDFERGERIAGFTFWQDQESNPANTNRENSGRIAGIRIEKAGIEPNYVEFCLGEKDDMLTYSFSENPYEELGGLAWSFNHQCDHIQIRTRSPTSRPGTILVLHNMIDFWPNSRIPSKLFWQVQDYEGNWLQVSRIHAVFNDDEKRLSGFIFDYGDGRVCRHVGHIAGVMASMSLTNDERVTRMDVLTGRCENEVIFYTSAHRVCALSAFSSSSEPRHQISSEFEVFMLDEPHVLKTDYSPVLRGTLPEPPKILEVESCVGIWVTMKIFPRARNLVEAVGPIFTKNEKD